MKDFFGTELSVGDVVAFEEPGYRNLILGTITKFTPKNVRLSWRGNYKTDETFVTAPNNVIKKP